MSEEIANHSDQVATIEPTNVTATPEVVTTQPTEISGIPIKFNGEEKVVSLEEAPTLIQKGMNYDKAIERAKQEARDAYFAEQNYVHPINGQPIKTEAEYKQAVKDQESFESYQKEGYPDEAIQRLLAVEKSQKETAAKLSEYESKSRTDTEFKAFLEAYPDAKGEDIPATVWAEFNEGKSLVDAYAKHENQILKQKLAEVEQQKQIEQKNLENAASSTGSVTGNGANVPTFFTHDQVSKMSEAEVNKNWNAINESMKKW